MKNTIKMSLVAALAVAGLSTTASAAGLEEAIKGVTISGKMEVEYDYTSSTTAAGVETTTNGWDYDLDVTAKIPVNDMVTATVGLQADHGKDINTKVDGSDADVDVSALYFTYANGPATVMVGKQGMAGAPWFDDEKANGIVGLFAAGPVTLAAAHFTGNNAAATTGTSADLNKSDISALAVIGSMGPVNASLWYANLSGITGPIVGSSLDIEADSYSLNLNGTFGIVTADIRYTDTDYDLANGGSSDADLLKVIVSADFGMITPYIGYGTTNDEQNSVAGVDLTNDNDAATNFGTEQLFIDDLDDADAFLIGATLKVDAWKFDLSYVDGEYKPTANGADADFDEALLDVEYKMSKNFTIDAFYSDAELNNVDMESASIALEYKF